jgi:transcriptional regulator with XRE-family HTH domain
MAFSVGELLKQERIRQNLPLAEIEKKTRIRVKLLQAIEDNNWQVFSSKIYIIGVIKNYAKILNLDEKKMLAFFRRDFAKKEDFRFRKKIANKFFQSESKTFSILGVILIVLLFSLYFLYQLKLYFTPPSVVFISPTTQTVFRTDRVKIIAKTQKDAVVNILGEKIYPDKEGNFEYIFPLLKANNELVIEVIGANGKKTVIKKNFLRQ